MNTFFTFHWHCQVITLSLLNVSIRDCGDSIALSEIGCDNPFTWEVDDIGDIALLRSWLSTNSLGGEIFVQGAE